MSDRPTPETDAKHWAIIGNEEIMVTQEIDSMTDFARKLERQRDAAIERFQSSQEARASLKRELDEAREQIAKANSERENDTQAELAAWELLRDTRELARELMEALDRVINNGHAHNCLFLLRADGECDCGVDDASAIITKAKEVLP